MKLTRTIVLGIAFLMPSVGATIARADDKPAAARAAAAAAAEGEKKAKKGKKAEGQGRGRRQEGRGSGRWRADPAARREEVTTSETRYRARKRHGRGCPAGPPGAISGVSFYLGP